MGTALVITLFKCTAVHPKFNWVFVIKVFYDSQLRFYYVLSHTPFHVFVKELQSTRGCGSFIQTIRRVDKLKDPIETTWSGEGKKKSGVKPIHNER